MLTLRNLRALSAVLAAGVLACEDGSTAPETEHSGITLEMAVVPSVTSDVSGSVQSAPPPAAGSPVIFDQGPSTGSLGSCFSNQLGQNFAEQFSFPSDMLITDIHIFTCIPPQIESSVHLKVLGDASGNPSPFLYEEDTTPLSWVADGGVFKVTALLSTPFLANAGTRYWIGMHGNGFELAQYGVFAPGDGKMAVFSGRPFKRHEATGDMMFQLTGVPAVSNSPPVVATDTDPVTVDEGQTANNTGSVSDADGDAVTLNASIGAVTNNNDGTWSWSFGTTDGPTESQTVIIDADDGNGGEAQTSFTLTVNNVAPTVTSVSVPGAPVAIGDQPISASGTFTDPAGTADETYTCTVDYGDGDGPQAGTVDGATCTGPDHTYVEAGIYGVTVAVTDKDGGTGSLTTESFIVIYDPSGGFVTGGGWIYSDAGSYLWDLLAEGKANFQSVSRYKKGATIPTGNTEFQFRAGDLNFHSSSYDFLVITMGGTNAQYKGSGTINGGLAPNGTEFRFMIWARDDSPDTFRIRIWWENGGENVVYDNGFNQPISGGSIVIHTK